ncbi:pseudouridine synthase [Thalassobacillus devorans]|uniref:Pseudouridine synthase n=1 Tax=Thalassobacillus devorans TaxID=279813 RepID=A0ABQ1NR14_9BACI|nr:RluA family pseudouridine synthase [Thalassobacillus devorans]NIK28896.1 23S rRNA pseudouridine1911/1915/1917 synthase [Thalassobacillus devorans]GGC82770.1 pseudouridine synthase [Thalassobacillus devorans]
MQMTKAGEWCEIIVPEEWKNKKIEQILKENLKIPKKMLHHFRMNKDVIVNGQTVSWSRVLQGGEILQIRLFQAEDYGIVPDNKKLDVLLEDDHLLVVNKPAGIDTHPNVPGQTGTLANRVAFYFQENRVLTKVRHIHRLDRETSGAVLFAKHALAGATLDRYLEQRSISRTYLAIVHGQLKRSEGVIDKPIGKDRHHPTRKRVSPGGQKAVTEYKVLNYDTQQNVSLVKLKLQTGRTHQIRVHMSHIGHPVAGDRLYGNKKDGYDRQALHAATLSFPHPITGEQLTSVAPSYNLPLILQKEIDRMTAYYRRDR